MDSTHPAISINARPLPFAMESSQTAVIVIDMQNEFASEGGAFARAGFNIAPIESIIAPTPGVLAAAQNEGLKIVYLKQEFRPDLSDIGAPGSKSWMVLK